MRPRKKILLLATEVAASQMKMLLEVRGHYKVFNAVIYEAATELLSPEISLLVGEVYDRSSDANECLRG